MIEKFAKEYYIITCRYDGGRGYTWEQAYNELWDLERRIRKHASRKSHLAILKRLLLAEVEQERKRIGRIIKPEENYPEWA